MPTLWSYPSIITQYQEVPQHISWITDFRGYNVLRADNRDFIGTEKPLLHISNFSVNDLKMKTAYLYLTGFNFENIPGTVAGIELEVDMRRGGRITDDTIQLRHNDMFIGESRATATLENQKIFGGETDLWGAEITNTMLSDVTFGVALRFQSHPSWPHRETPMINYVRIRIW